MSEFRFAKESDIPSLKELWKICFGDEDSYIDFYFEKKFKREETLLSLCNGEIAAMLTMIPVNIVMAGNSNLKASMIYAVGTHPKFRGRGLSTKLMEYSNEYLLNNNIDASILTPATESLFKFYSKQGYIEGFYIKEALLTLEDISKLKKYRDEHCEVMTISPEEYNLRRKKLLQGKFYVDYRDEEISYQKDLSKYSRADIYGLDIEHIKGCAIVERINSEKVIIKELLMPQELMSDGVIQIVKELPAKEYIVRSPAFLSEDFEGAERAFGMIHFHRSEDDKVVLSNEGYMGIAYD